MASSYYSCEGGINCNVSAAQRVNVSKTSARRQYDQLKMRFPNTRIWRLQDIPQICHWLFLLCTFNALFVAKPFPVTPPIYLVGKLELFPGTFCATAHAAAPIIH